MVGTRRPELLTSVVSIAPPCRGCLNFYGVLPQRHSIALSAPLQLIHSVERSPPERLQPKTMLAGPSRRGAVTGNSIPAKISVERSWASGNGQIGPASVGLLCGPRNQTQSSDSRSGTATSSHRNFCERYANYRIGYRAGETTLKLTIQAG